MKRTEENKSYEEKLIEAILSPGAIAEDAYRRARTRFDGLLKTYVGGLKQYILTGISTAENSMTFSWRKFGTAKRGMIVVKKKGSDWDWDEISDKLPEGTTPYMLVAYLLTQFAEKW